MDKLIVELSLSPGTADVIQRVAEALGTSVEDILSVHLETLRTAVNYTPSRYGHKISSTPMQVIISEELMTAA
ncbi:hypothetical protein KQ304_08475 [Synechococcus sp. CS-1329]|uniref:hypothetical protein n=1 Tax=Synechococcus sp. CS-1329 TaxID=2847975 RepID=UPI00223C187A|nr:hypothetical protein [Synechococcus sp. CS-1329]MCT0219031.1 hypothetical protein [Synechococcus sp. CS-1329]